MANKNPHPFGVRTPYATQQLQVESATRTGGIAGPIHFQLSVASPLIRATHKYKDSREQFNAYTNV